MAEIELICDALNTTDVSEDETAGTEMGDDVTAAVADAELIVEKETDAEELCAKESLEKEPLDWLNKEDVRVEY
jgi:hypothetical protein